MEVCTSLHSGLDSEVDGDVLRRDSFLRVALAIMNDPEAGIRSWAIVVGDIR
jgi:hypothetical protein